MDFSLTAERLLLNLCVAFHQHRAGKGLQIAPLWIERHAIGAQGSGVTDVQSSTLFFVIDFQSLSFTGEFSS